MEDLIKALQIFLKYGNEEFPTHCEHDILYVCGYNRHEMTEEDVNQLNGFGFIWDDDEEYFLSYRYGSC